MRKRKKSESRPIDRIPVYTTKAGSQYVRAVDVFLKRIKPTLQMKHYNETGREKGRSFWAPGAGHTWFIYLEPTTHEFFLREDDGQIVIEVKALTESCPECGEVNQEFTREPAPYAQIGSVGVFKVGDIVEIPYFSRSLTGEIEAIRAYDNGEVLAVVLYGRFVRFLIELSKLKKP